MGRGSSGQAIAQTAAFRGLSEAKRKDIYYFYDSNGLSKYSDDALKKMGANISDEIKYNIVLFNENLPEYTGTEKQVDFARSLAKKAILKDVREAANYYNNSSVTKSQKDEIFSNAKQAGVAQNISAVIKSDVQDGDAYKIAHSTKSAGEVIDKLKRLGYR